MPISGEVLIDGKPLEFGYVRFVPSNSRPSGGSLDSQGRFYLTCIKDGDGAVLGKHRVEVLAQQVLSETKMRWLAPKKYSSRSTSGLTYEVTGPADNVRLNLTWDGGHPFVETIEGAEQEGSDPYP